MKREQLETNAKQEIINQEINKDIDELYDHAKIANGEMGDIKVEMGIVKNEIYWIKEKANNIDSKVWWLITGGIFGVLMVVLNVILSLRK